MPAHRLSFAQAAGSVVPPVLRTHAHWRLVAWGSPQSTVEAPFAAADRPFPQQTYLSADADLMLRTRPAHSRPHVGTPSALRVTLTSGALAVRPSAWKVMAGLEALPWYTPPWP